MAEIWGAAIAVGGAVISGVAAEKKAKKDRANANEDRRAATKEEAQYGSALSKFDKEQDYYYEQLQRQNRQRGLDQFRSFSNLQSYAPQYQGDTARITLPAAPDINSIISQAAPPEQPAATSNKKRSTASKILDPAGLFG